MPKTELTVRETGVLKLNLVKFYPGMHFVYALMFAFCIATVSDVFSQSLADVKNSGLDQQPVSNMSQNTILGKKGNYVFALCRAVGALTSSDAQLQRFNLSTSKVDFNKKLKGEIAGKDIYYHNVLLFNQKLLAVGSARMKKDKKKLVVTCAEWIDDNGEKAGAPIAIDEWPEKSAYDCKIIEVKPSDDGTKLLVVQYDYNTKPNYLVRVTVFDADLKKVADVDFGTATPDRSIDEYRIFTSLDKFGNINMLYQYDRVKAEKRYFQDAYAQKVLRYNLAEKQLRSAVIDPGSRKLTSFRYLVNPQGQMVIAGFTSNYQSDNAGGIFTQVFDFKSDRPIATKDILFPASVLSKFKSDQKGDRNQELDNFMLMDIAALPNGNFVLSAQYVITNYYGTNRTGYEYDDILIFCVSPGTGEIRWTQHIPLRNQRYNNRYGCMSALHCLNSDVNLFYNDNKSSFGGGPLKEAGGKDNVSALARIDEKGNLVKQLLFETGTTGAMINPNYFKAADKEVLIHMLDADGSKTGYTIVTLK